MLRFRKSFDCVNRERPPGGSAAVTTTGVLHGHSAPLRGLRLAPWWRLLPLITAVAVLLCGHVAHGSLTLKRTQCTIQKGRCMYYIRMSHGCAQDAFPYATNDVQNDYDERVNEIEKGLTTVRTDHTRRINDLENTITGLLKGPHHHRRHGSIHDTSHGPGGPDQPQGRDHNTDHTHRDYNKFKLDPDPDRRENELLNMIHNQFTDLRTELEQTKARLLESERALTDSRSKLNQTESVLARTTKKLLTTEQELGESREEQSRLRATLQTTQAECNETKASLRTARRRVRSQNIELMRARRENERLRRELREMRALLERTRRLLAEALRKYHELNVRHEAVNLELAGTKANLVECYKGKTSSTCGFEDKDICGFVQADNSTDFHDWVRHHGPTPSGWTGPSADHTCGNDRGYYMYVEASTRGEGQTAHLISPKYQGMGEQCVEFYYHMYGRDIGTLNVHTPVLTGEDFDPMWRAFGNQGDVWTKARISIPDGVAKRGYQVVFAAHLEYGYQGDIAIDDVRIFDGECYHIMTAEEMAKKFNVTFPPPSTQATPSP